MVICEACGEEAEVLYKCNVCSVMFCAECGYPEEGICDVCARARKMEGINGNNI